MTDPRDIMRAGRAPTYAECLSRRAGCAAEDLYLSFQLHAHGKPLGLPERTSNTPGSRLRWNEWVTFRAKYRDLSPDAHIMLTLYGSVMGGVEWRRVTDELILVPSTGAWMVFLFCAYITLVLFAIMNLR